MSVAAIAVGSNLGDRVSMVRGAARSVAALEGTLLLAQALPVETRAVGPGEQGDYLNGALLVVTRLSARALLSRLLSIEALAGRDRSAGERWGARTLDLDLLLFGGEVIESAGLSVPHPRMHERWFVLEPLRRVAPGWVHPVLGRTVDELCEVVSGRDG